MKRSNPKDVNPWKAAGLVSAIGADLVVCMLGGYYGGSYIAARTNQPIWTAAGLMIGLAIGIVTIVLLIKHVLEESHDGSDPPHT